MEVLYSYGVIQPPSKIFVYVIYAGTGLVVYRRVNRVATATTGSGPDRAHLRAINMIPPNRGVKMLGLEYGHISQSLTRSFLLGSTF